MKKVNLFIVALSLLFTGSVLAQDSGKIVSSKTHIKFFSTTAAEDIEANNYASVSTINKETGAVVFSVPMQSFEFEKALMQKHFNQEKFLDTKVYPKAKLKGSIINIKDIDFSKDGTYEASVKGELSIKGKTNTIESKGTITVKDGLIEVNSVFSIILADYGVNFAKGKPSSNIAKAVEVTVVAEYGSK